MPLPPTPPPQTASMAVGEGNDANHGLRAS